MVPWRLGVINDLLNLISVNLFVTLETVQVHAYTCVMSTGVAVANKFVYVQERKFNVHRR